jgi:amino acid adenylation domain-containing protein
LVTAQAQATPDALAITAGNHSLSYGELEDRSTQVAHCLQSFGVGPEILVGICLERSVSMIVLALAVLKAGGAYVPLDPSYPPDRLSFMVEDAKPKVVLTRSALSKRLPKGVWKYLTLDRLPRLTKPGAREFLKGAASPENLAYIIYTSGSTGSPKGVEITHGSLSNLVSWHQRAFNITAADRATLLSSPSFDAAVWEVWPYLTLGASVHLPEDLLRSAPEALRDWLVAQRITIGFVPTPLAERVISLPWPLQPALRILLTGGDMLHRYPPSGLPFHLVNNYGPTECTVVATSGIVPPDDHPAGPPSIGRPIANAQVQILDESQQPVPAGTAGEIYIGGAGLARGYLNQPKLTHERFIPNPRSTNTRDRLYKTGDLARWQPDGQIEFLGRSDDQIKIRGFRIEPNEIIRALNSHPSVEASTVLARKDSMGEWSLVAYLEIRPDMPISASSLREFLRSKVPEYMLPSAFVRMHSLPVTPNDKIDRAALPAPDAANTLRDTLSTAPGSPTEKEVARIVANLLGIEGVGRDDNFFLLGGHSLLGTQLIMHMGEVFGAEISLAYLFDNPTVGGIAAEIDRFTFATQYGQATDEVTAAHGKAGSRGDSLWL